MTIRLRLCAALLAGDMPEDIELAFAAAGTSLLPASAKEMTTAWHVSKLVEPVQARRGGLLSHR